MIRDPLVSALSVTCTKGQSAFPVLGNDYILNVFYATFFLEQNANGTMWYPSFSLHFVTPKIDRPIILSLDSYRNAFYLTNPKMPGQLCRGPFSFI